jgi:hypothetical protein
MKPNATLFQSFQPNRLPGFTGTSGINDLRFASIADKSKKAGYP